MIVPSSLAQQSTRLIWLISEFDNKPSLLVTLLETWHYQIIKIPHSVAMLPEIKDPTIQPDLIILDIVPLQRNIIQLIENYSLLSDVPLLCLCPPGGLTQTSVMAFGATAALNKPFELEQLDLQLQKILKSHTNPQQSNSARVMTLLFSETESSSLLQEQAYWSKIFQTHPEPKARELLIAEGYEINPELKRPSQP